MGSYKNAHNSPRYVESFASILSSSPNATERILVNVKHKEHEFNSSCN
jgi:hypothetical protein